MDRNGKVLPVITATTIFIWIMLLLLVVAMSIWLFSSRERAEQRIEERALAAAKIVSTNVRWIDSLAWQALQRIDQSLGASIGTGDNQSIGDIDKAVGDLPGEVEAYVVDRNGRTRYSSQPNMRHGEIGNEEYFKELAQGKDRYISAMLVGRQNNEQVFLFGRRIERNGEFQGAALVSFPVASLSEVWEAAALGWDSVVSLVRKDGKLVGRYPAKADGPANFADKLLFTDHLPRYPSGTYLTTSPTSEKRKIVGYKVVDGTSLIVLATADYGSAMVPFWKDALAAGLVVAAGGTGSAAAIRRISILARRDAETSHRLTATLEENRMLLREVHHRVKNNLQAVQAIIRMQQLPEAVQKSLTGRLGAMMTVHQQIYGHDQFDAVPAKQLVPALVSTIVQTHQQEIETVYDIDDIVVSGDKATSVALLLNELVTNSMKYGFAAGSGALRVELKRMSDHDVRLLVADDGPGFDENKISEGMGSKLVRGVVAQLHGSFRYFNQNGTSFVAEIEL